MIHTKINIAGIRRDYMNNSKLDAITVKQYSKIASEFNATFTVSKNSPILKVEKKDIIEENSYRVYCGDVFVTVHSRAGSYCINVVTGEIKKEEADIK